MACFFLQVLLKVSVNLAVSVYGTVCLIAAVASMLLPIETKGRELQVGTLGYSGRFCILNVIIYCCC